MNHPYIDSSSSSWTTKQTINSDTFKLLLQRQVSVDSPLPSSQDSGVCLEGTDTVDTENGNYIKTELGVDNIIKLEPVDNSWTEDLENRSTVSCDSGYISTSLNFSMNSTLTSSNQDDYDYAVNDGQYNYNNNNHTNSICESRLIETGCHPSLEHLFVNRTQHAQEIPSTVSYQNTVKIPVLSYSNIVKIPQPGQPNILSHKSNHSAASANKPIGYYAQTPTYIQPKIRTSTESDVHTASMYAPLAPTSVVPLVSMSRLPSSKPDLITRSHQRQKRKAQHVLKVDEYRPEDVKPSQELLAARRLLEEALITGNIVSQVRYARIKKSLQLEQLRQAQKSTIMESFAGKASKINTDDNTIKISTNKLESTRSNALSQQDVDKRFPKSARVLFQENRRLEGCNFSWKIGYNGPHRSFNKVSVRRSGRKKRKKSRKPFVDLHTCNNDENALSKRRRLF